MNIHRLALVKWLLRAVSGALSADGDATGETSTEDPEDEADHPPLDPPLEELRARCAHAWNPFPFKVGTQPFKTEAWNYFYPCEDLCSVEDDMVLEPYDGQVKCMT